MFRTAWFLESVLSELLVTFALRSRLPLRHSGPGGWSPIPAAIAVMVAAVLAAYLLSAELLKRRVFARFEL